ncbi:MAG: MMPL family transporter, partial [Thermomicrobiales bacterium]
MNDSFARWGAAMVKLRWFVLIFWIVLIPIAGGLGASKASSVLKGGGFFSPGSESDKAAAILASDFNAAANNNALIVFHSDKLTVDDSAFQQAVTDTTTRVQGVDGVSSIASYYKTHDNGLLSADKHTTLMVVTLKGTEDDASKKVPKLHDQLPHDNADIVAYVTGAPAINHALESTIEEDLTRSERFTIPIIVILLLLVFRTVISAAIPLVLGASSVVTAMALIHLIGSHKDLSIFALSTASMIGLGLGIDFSLIVVSRFREELAAGRDTKSAVAMTLATAGRSITYSGLTVILGMLVLTLMFNLILVRSMSFAIMLVAMTALLAGLTLLPALLGILGRRIDWLPVLPKPKVSRPGHAGFWYRLSHAIMRHPWVWLLVSLALLLALAIPVKDIKLYGATPQVLPDTNEAVVGYNLLSSAFGANTLTPIQLVVETSATKDGVWQTSTLDALGKLQDAIKTDPRVQSVSSVLTLAPDTPHDQLHSTITGNQNLAGAVTQYVNGDGTTAVINVVPKTDQFHTDHQQLVRDLRSTIVPGVTEMHPFTVQIGGQAANFVDLRDTIYDRFPFLVAAVLGLTFLLLMMFFQSLALPLKAILMNLASIMATYGVLVLVFVHGIGIQVYGVDAIGALSVVTPVILFVILFGLSTDYEVFMLSRVKEFYHHTGNNEEAVATGLETTARVITAAGLILIGTFGSFSLARVISLKETGLGLAVGVLLDSTIVRIIMVPATMRLMGNANWYMPGWLKKIVPELREGPAEEFAPAGVPALAAAGAPAPLPPSYPGQPAFAGVGAPPPPPVNM